MTLNPALYGNTRNFKDGAVTRLSPYISRGFLSTKLVLDTIRSMNVSWQEAEKLVQELLWRDYWQRIWQTKGDGIFNDLKQPQKEVLNYGISKKIISASTGIDAIDEGIQDFYKTGYMHNHMRMYVAALCCNIAKSHWLNPSKWMYAHLLDGDLASNNLSWQWVAGANASKKYYANQQNINKYFLSNQEGTFIDVPYSEFEQLKVPNALEEITFFKLKASLPKLSNLNHIENKKTLIYNYYNIDPYWRSNEDAQRVLLLEPSVFEKFPVVEKCIQFAIDLSDNISGMQIYVGEFSDVISKIDVANIYYKEHPLNKHYSGKEDPREWMSDVTGNFSSFFGYWKKCKKQLQW